MERRPKKDALVVLVLFFFFAMTDAFFFVFFGWRITVVAGLRILHFRAKWLSSCAVNNTNHFSRSPTYICTTNIALRIYTATDGISLLFTEQLLLSWVLFWCELLKVAVRGNELA